MRATVGRRDTQCSRDCLRTVPPTVPSVKVCSANEAVSSTVPEQEGCEFATSRAWLRLRVFFATAAAANVKQSQYR